MTRLGEFLVQFPLPPNLTCAVIKAASLDCEDLLLPIAAMLSVENVFIRPGRKPLIPKHSLGWGGMTGTSLSNQAMVRQHACFTWRPAASPLVVFGANSL